MTSFEQFSCLLASLALVFSLVNVCLLYKTLTDERRRAKYTLLIDVWDAMAELIELPSGQSVPLDAAINYMNSLEKIAFLRVERIVPAEVFDRLYKSNFITHYKALIAMRSDDGKTFTEYRDDLYYITELYSLYVEKGGLRKR